MSDNRIRDLANLLDAVTNMYHEHEDTINNAISVSEPVKDAQFNKEKNNLVITAETKVENTDDIEVNYNYTDNVIEVINKTNSFMVDIPDGYRPAFNGEVTLNNGVAEMRFPVQKTDTTEDDN